MVTVRQIGDVVFVRFHDLADAVVDMRAGTATIDVSLTAPHGMDEVLAAGPVLALALALMGRPCLHASAVSIGDGAVAFAAPSGGGKSTLAALACLAGAELVADDILALGVETPEVRCLTGSRELRLRPATAQLLAGAPWPRRKTADAKVAVLAGREDPAAPRLAAIVLPVISADGTTRIEPVGGSAAIRALLACARVVSLQTPEHHMTMLELVATLASTIPVYRVTMPALASAALPEPISAVLDEHLGRRV